MTLAFERNISPKTPREIEAEGMVQRLSRLDERGDINLGYVYYVETELERQWMDEGYRSLQTFVDEQGFPIVIARHESDVVYDEEGRIKPGMDIRYRIFLESGTRTVTIPTELTGEVPQTMDRGDTSIYLADETTLLELSLRDDAADFSEDLEWLGEQFGPSLAIARPPLSFIRLDGANAVVGVSRTSFSPMSESDL